jgi:putative OPT family oligopeptide transporter
MVPMSDKQTAGAIELSIRGFILGILITVVFTAANVYLGLKVGLTFATSIPAAVISMAVLSAFRNSTILENNIVQTIASAAGTLSSIIFVLPGLLIVGWWNGFPFWQSFAVCAVGGILGVLFTIPLRRTLVTGSDLPYPEGVAAAEVLIVGSEGRDAAAGASSSREGLLAVIYGAVASAGLVALEATHIAAGEIQSYFRFGSNGASSYDVGFSLALFGAGQLVGLSVGMALALGLAMTWAGIVPILTSIEPAGALSLADHVDSVFRHQVRFIGAGAIAVAALWSLAKLAGPLAQGLIVTFTSKRAAGTDARRDKDLPPTIVIALTLICLALSAALVYQFALATTLGFEASTLTLASVPYILFGGFLIAAICGYMAGLIGSSNSPISGVGILAILICAGGLVAITHPPAELQRPLTAFALFATSIVFAVATISNNNLQDLKTGQLVGASPWRQQFALIIGVIAGSIVIPPVLNLLANADGFAGMASGAIVHLHPLPAPQANLIAALARGVIEHNLDWRMLGIGAGLGVVIVLLDEVMGLLGWLRLPPLAVGIAVYLPMSATVAVIAGAFVGDLYNRYAARAKDPKRSERLAVLAASGMIVGESLFGVALAGLITAAHSGFISVGDPDAPLALVPADFAPANAIGWGAFLILALGIYGWMVRRSRAT